MNGLEKRNFEQLVASNNQRFIQRRTWSLKILQTRKVEIKARNYEGACLICNLALLMARL